MLTIHTTILCPHFSQWPQRPPLMDDQGRVGINNAVTGPCAGEFPAHILDKMTRPILKLSENMKINLCHCFVGSVPNLLVNYMINVTDLVK